MSTATGGKKPRVTPKSIAGGIARFFREYKSEVKKVVWPGPKQVFNNTLVTIIMMLVVGAFIWIIDTGLAELLSLILGVKSL